MAKVVFYQKTDCLTNAIQRRWLESAGHELVVRDLLREPWTKEGLRAFFGDLPVDRWFNSNAPQVKSGEIRPRDMDETTALECMLDNPLLIRRPLMRRGDECVAGFEPRDVDAWIGLSVEAPPGEAVDCAHGDTGTVCGTP